MRAFTRTDRRVPIYMAGLFIGLAGCGDGGGSSTSSETGVPGLEASIEFTATIEGQVTDGETGEPLEGITVELSAIGVEVEGSEEEASEDEEMMEEEMTEEEMTEEMAVTSIAATSPALRKARTGLTTTTDENGEWQLNINTAGTHTLVHHGMASNGKSYARTRQTVTVDPNALLPDSAAGQYVIGITSNQEMYPKDGTLSATVYGSNQRDVIAGARVIIRYTSGSIVDPDLPTETTTDDDGKFELEGLPSGVQFQVQVRPVDRDDDGTLDTQNYLQWVTVYGDGGSTETFIGPVGALVSPKLLWTNVDSMRTFPVDPTFEFVFSHAMDTSASSADIFLRDANGNELPTTQEWTDDFTLTVMPASSLKPGRNYNISGTAYSMEPSAISFGTWTIRTEGGADDEPTPAKPVLLSDSTSIGFYTTSFRIGLMPLEFIDNWVVFVRTDSGRDWIEVDRVTPNGHSPYQDVTFHVSGSELTQATTPTGSGSLFSHGGALQVAVAAEVGEVMGPLSPVLEIERDACLTGVRVGAGTSDSPSYADNTDGLQNKPLVIALSATGQQWLASDFEPMLSVNSTSLVFDSLTASDFEMVRPNPWTVEWRAWIPPEADAQFLEYMVDISGLADVNGNELCDPDTVVPDGLVPTQGSPSDYRWDFEGGAQGWTSTGDWSRGEPTYTDGNAPTAAPRDEDSPNMFGTGLSAARSDDTTSVLTSPTFRTPASSFGLYFRYWFDAYYDGSAYDGLEVVFIDEDDEDAEYVLVDLASPNTYWATFNSTSDLSFFSLPEDTHGHLEFRVTTRDGSGSALNAGAFVDDVTVTGTSSRKLVCPDIASCYWL